MGVPSRCFDLAELSVQGFGRVLVALTATLARLVWFEAELESALVACLRGLDPQRRFSLLLLGRA